MVCRRAFLHVLGPRSHPHFVFRVCRHPHRSIEFRPRHHCARGPVGARQFSQLPVVVARQGQEAVSQEECDQFASFDGGFEKYQLAPTDPLDKSDRAFVYGINGGAKVIAGSMARLAVMKIIASLSASADVLAMSATEVDISSIKPGENVTVKFRGKPVFVRRRTQDEIDQANAVDVSGLRDPETDAVRVKNPEWLIVLAVCTHLGCVPIPNAGSFGGYFAPATDLTTISRDAFARDPLLSTSRFPSTSSSMAPSS